MDIDAVRPIDELEYSFPVWAIIDPKKLADGRPLVQAVVFVKDPENGRPTFCVFTEELFGERFSPDDDQDKTPPAESPKVQHQPSERI